MLEGSLLGPPIARRAAPGHSPGVVPVFGSGVGYVRGMADILEGTPEFNRGHSLATGEIPITVHDGQGTTPDMFREFTRLAHDDDPFTDDTPLACGVENPEGCESCD